MPLPEVTREVFFVLVERGEDGVHVWDVEKALPTRHNLGRALDRLVGLGLARVELEPHGVKAWKRYVHTGKQIGPQAKLTAFVEVPA